MLVKKVRSLKFLLTSEMSDSSTTPLEEDLIGIELISLSSSNKPGTSTENCPWPVSISPAITA